MGRQGHAPHRGRWSLGPCMVVVDEEINEHGYEERDEHSGKHLPQFDRGSLYLHLV